MTNSSIGGEAAVSTLQEGGGTDRPRLARRLTLTHAVLYGLGVTIGAGIYVLIGTMAGRAGVHAPIAFLLAALVMGLTAAAYAELAVRFPVSAGAAAFTGIAFASPRVTLGVGVLTAFIGTVSAAAIAIGCAGYIRVFVDLPPALTISLVVLAMAAVAAWGIRESVTFAGVMTLIEIGGLVAIIVGALATKPEIVREVAQVLPPLSSHAVWIGLIGASMMAFFAFIGFEDIANIAEEVQEPAHTLPRAIFLTLGIATLLYVLVAVTAVLVVPPAELAASKAPLAIVFERVSPLPAVTFAGIAVIATLNGIIVQMIMVSRVLYGLADRGVLPAPLAHVHPVTQTPLLATALVAAATLALALAFPLEALAETTSRITLVVFALVNAALVRIKLEAEPDPAGSDAFRVPLWVPVAGALSCTGFLIAGFAR
jgi:amino acid transporter